MAEDRGSLLQSWQTGSYRTSICPCVHKNLCCFTKSLITIPDRVTEECAARQMSHRMCFGLFCIAPPQGNVISAPTNSKPTLSDRSLHVTEALWRSGLLSVLRSTHSSSWSSLEHGAVASSCSRSLKARRFSRVHHRFLAAVNWRIIKQTHKRQKHSCCHVVCRLCFLTVGAEVFIGAVWTLLLAITGVSDVDAAAIVTLELIA